MDLKTAEKALIAKERVKQEMSKKQHQVLRLCAKGIRRIHTGELKEAEKLKKQAKGILSNIEKKLGHYPVLKQKILGICYQEYTELAVMLSVLKDNALPSLDVPADAYVLGILDAIGEMKREVMTRLLKGNVEEALMLYNKMEDIYYAVEGSSFPYTIVPGLKPKQDVMKRVLEGLYVILVEAQTRNR